MHDRQSVATVKRYVWDADRPPREIYAELGAELSLQGDLFRPAHGPGLLRITRDFETASIDSPKLLLAAILDRMDLVVVRNGKPTGSGPSTSHLSAMLHADVFLQPFERLDRVLQAPRYLAGFELTERGYNRCGAEGYFYAGPQPKIADDLRVINQFLDVMPFASTADRTNALAAALTVALHNHWPGGKPILVATASKSHAGKDTILDFATGLSRKASVTYESADWALQKGIVATLTQEPDISVVVIENARLDGSRERKIRSGFVERLVTDPCPILFSSGVGQPNRRVNDLVVAISTNEGMLSTDLLNRSLPIHLTPVGNIEDRRSAIGNPRYEFLPKNAEQIAAELRGMIERWKQAGRPLDETVRHPFTAWAQTVGGILRVNGCEDFLANYGHRKTTDDPIRQALAVLGSSCPDAWLPVTEWAVQAEQQSLISVLVNQADRGSLKGRARGMGIALTAHVDETFSICTETERLTLRLQRARRRFAEVQTDVSDSLMCSRAPASRQPHARYRFDVVAREPLPYDVEEQPSTPTTPATGSPE